jgi:PAS domain S-box-containing protein
MNKTPDGFAASDVQRLEFAMDVGNLAWWEMDCETGAVWFHRRKTDMLGYEPEPFTHYTHFTALLHPDDLEPAMQAMREHLAGARPAYRVEYRIKTKNGAYRWFEDVGRISARDDTGRPRTVTGIVLDITDRKKADEALSVSEERFRKMFHGHSAVKLVIDLETGAIVDANEAAAGFYGWSIGDLKQMRIQQINDLPPDAVKDRMASAAAAPNARFEFRHRRADGSITDVEVYSNHVEIAGQTYLYSIVHDISDRKRAESALKVSEQRFRMLAENAADALWVLDDETGRYQYVSPSIVDILGYSTEEFMNFSVQESLAAESYAALRRDRVERIQEFERGVERTYVDIVETPHRDGSRVILEVHGRFVRNAETNRLEVIGVSRDITERKQIEEERERLIEELRHAIEQVKTLKGIVPICASCKKIRDDQGYWEQVEAYVVRHTDAQFSHSICPECAMKMYGEFLSDEE